MSPTAAVFQGRVPKGFPADLARRARAKLLILDVAMSLEDLRSPPANRLEALRGGRAGQHSVRVSDQWRVCFVRRDRGAHGVEVVDYHRGNRAMTISREDMDAGRVSLDDGGRSSSG